MTTQPRGVRINNPGNLDRNSTKWQGMADDQSADPRFAVFKTPQWGIRAAARLLLTYQTQYHLDTVRKIIARWAPTSENDTEAYVTDVAERVGVGPDDVIDVDSVAVMKPLIAGIFAHENSNYAYPDAVLLEGLHMAGVADAKPKPLVKQKGFVAQAAGGVAVCGATVAQYAEPTKKVAAQLADFTGAPIIAHAQTILLSIAGVCVLAGVISAIAKQRAS